MYYQSACSFTLQSILYNYGCIHLEVTIKEVRDNYKIKTPVFSRYF